MGAIFSDENKYGNWRKSWVALAEAQAELGLAGVRQEQVDSLKVFSRDINYDVAEAREKTIRHDVMSHVYAFGQQCPEAAGIIHAGATSCDITDNTELMQMYQGLNLVRTKLVNVIKLFADFAIQHKDLACLGFTHYQPAQPTTLGKRAAMWAGNFVLDYHQVSDLQDNWRLRGLKGATGTQASFLELAEGDEAKVVELERRFLLKLGCNPDYAFIVTGQTYPRKYDSMTLQVLAGIGESAHKFGIDARILQNRKELEEPFEKNQVGSSAMAYKRNPMRLERMCGLARGLFARVQEARMTSSVQFLERTLDDSAPRRDYIAQAFIGADEVLNLAMNVMENPSVFPAMIKRNLDLELPFMVTENILMAAVKAGKDRQEIHERIRQHSQKAAELIKETGADNRLLEMLASDPLIGMSLPEIKAEVDVHKFIGRAPSQVQEFYDREVTPILEAEKDNLGDKSSVDV